MKSCREHFGLPCNRVEKAFTQRSWIKASSTVDVKRMSSSMDIDGKGMCKIRGSSSRHVYGSEYIRKS